MGAAGWSAPATRLPGQHPVQGVRPRASRPGRSLVRLPGVRGRARPDQDRGWFRGGHQVRAWRASRGRHADRPCQRQRPGFPTETSWVLAPRKSPC